MILVLACRFIVELVAEVRTMQRTHMRRHRFLAE